MLPQMCHLHAETPAPSLLLPFELTVPRKGTLCFQVRISIVRGAAFRQRKEFSFSQGREMGRGEQAGSLPSLIMIQGLHLAAGSPMLCFQPNRLLAAAPARAAHCYPHCCFSGCFGPSFLPQDVTQRRGAEENPSVVATKPKGPQQTQYPSHDPVPCNSRHMRVAEPAPHLQ